MLAESTIANELTTPTGGISPPWPTRSAPPAMTISGSVTEPGSGTSTSGPTFCGFSSARPKRRNRSQPSGFWNEPDDLPGEQIGYCTEQ